jgi:predicted N-acetyltransferase YhbS
MNDSSAIVYAVEARCDPDEYVDVLRRSGLAARRPIGDAARIRRMAARTDLLVTARDGAGRLVGLARSLTDFAFVCYLADLCVDQAIQRRGVGRELVRRTRVAAGGADVTLVLLAAPLALDYYPRIGLRRIDRCFGLMAGQMPTGDDD